MLRVRTRQARLSFLVLGLACCLLPPSFEAEGQAPKEPERKKDLLERIQEDLERFSRIQRAADEYIKGLALDGKSAQDALTVLAERGFKCDIRIVGIGRMEKSGKKVGTYEFYDSWVERKPLISCTKAPTDIPECVEMSVSVSAHWQDAQRPPAELQLQASASPIHLVSGTCKVRSIGQLLPRGE